MKLKHLIKFAPLMLAVLLKFSSCEQEPPPPPPPPVTNSLNIGGCETNDCAQKTWDDFYNTDAEAYQLGRASVVLNSDKTTPVDIGMPHTGRMTDFCDWYGCGPAEKATHRLGFQLQYARGVSVSFDNVWGREYYADDCQHWFENSEGRDYRQTNYRSDGTSHLAWPCFTDDDRNVSRGTSIKHFKQVHTSKTVFKWGIVGESVEIIQDNYLLGFYPIF